MALKMGKIQSYKKPLKLHIYMMIDDDAGGGGDGDNGDDYERKC